MTEAYQLVMLKRKVVTTSAVGDGNTSRARGRSNMVGMDYGCYLCGWKEGFHKSGKKVQRGTVEVLIQGLNPLMFLFALIGNATYVGSIIMKTLEWKMLKPNMPWPVDAAVCVLLDCFILTQFLYYRTRKDDEHEGNINGDYEALKSYQYRACNRNQSVVRQLLYCI